MKTLRAGAGGFSLVEVMVALVVVAIGLLGLAKMESLALSSTNVSGLRSLAAIEAESLASQMHANRGYWATAGVTTAVTVTVAGGALSISDPTLSQTAACNLPYASQAPSCTPLVMAGYDLVRWGTNTFIGNGGNPAVLPGGSATITCTPLVTNVSPASCQVAITWLDNAVAVNKQQTGITQGNLTTYQNAAYTLKSTYTLYVQP
jgi:type IV pilus assembly protein PilV